MEKGKLGSAIRQARIANNLTQEVLAEIVGITPTHLKHIESEHRKPSIDVLFALASSLHFSLDSLFLAEEPSAEREQYYKEIYLLLHDCSTKELRALLAAARELTKQS
ncbi:helix-turn-helix domain-containing protein [Frisingicoccus sp.]|uniref:helix-turn-helix domain-containing protein n=1 Tax=Frisingicoccus sp. TaxID=1918627 RepID=UPI003AB3CE17